MNLKEEKVYKPLSVRLRPRKLEEFVGQEHILAEGKLLHRQIEEDKLTSMILYGPSGCGKTSLASVIAASTNCEFFTINATTSGVLDIKKILERAYMQKFAATPKKIILLIEEIHRFNRPQQDALLPDVEEANIIIIGTTTLNPYFGISSPLVSRCMIFELKPLSKKDLEVIINRALKDKERGLGKYKIELDNSAKELIINYSDGDARRVLNALELGTLIAKKNNNTGILNFDLKIAEEVMQRKKIVYDKSNDQHYDTISAFIKSMRGSDPDATVYWLAKMLYAGEDPRFIARRIAIHAVEDVGLADPQAIVIANSAFQILEFIGMPEARIALAEAALYVACAPKSNSCYKAIDEAILDIENELTKEIPKHLRNSHYKSAKKLQEKEYLYPHDYNEHFVKQEYLPNKKRYYQPTEQGYELKIKDRLKKLWQD